jgi:hypothetical protein
MYQKRIEKLKIGDEVERGAKAFFSLSGRDICRRVLSA